MPVKSNYEITESDLHLVTVIARSVQRRIRQDLYDDLVSAGYIGLVQASKSFVPANGYKFSTFAGYRIRGAMQDYLRRLDPNSRTTRIKVERGIVTSVLVKVDSLSECSVDNIADPLSTVTIDLRIDTRAVLSKLSEVSAAILHKHYFEGHSIREIAASMRLPHGIVMWLCSQALIEARGVMRVSRRGLKKGPRREI